MHDQPPVGLLMYNCPTLSCCSAELVDAAVELPEPMCSEMWWAENGEARQVGAAVVVVVGAMMNE